MPAEFVHESVLSALEKGLVPSILFPDGEIACEVEMGSFVPGLGRIEHPVGLAAGFDKDARTVKSIKNFGFAFLEFGTVTPLPQPGNPRPRLWRLKEKKALVNRMGFNNAGIEALLRNLNNIHNNLGPIGINIGKNKNTQLDKAIDDYRLCIEKIGGLADYIVINVSSPNTPQLRELANSKFIMELAQIARPRLKQVWIKLSPDIELQGFQSLIAVIQEQGFAGLILSNTKSIDRPYVGGLSGPSLAAAAEQRLVEAWQVHLGKLPMLSVGGVSSGLDVLRRLQRGAHAVQIYTAMIYQGPWVVLRILRELEQLLKEMKIKSINEVIGMHYR